MNEHKNHSSAITNNKATIHTPNDTELLQTLLSNIPGHVYQFYITDAGVWGFNYISTRTDTIVGKNWDEPDFMDYVTSFIQENQKIHFRQSIEKAARNLTPWSYDIKLAVFDNMLHVRARAKPVRRGNEVIFNGVLLDINEYSIAAEALNASEQRMHAIVANTQEIIHILDTQGFFSFLSPSWERVTGFSVAETLGKNYTEFVHPDDLADCTNLLEKVLKTGEPHKLLEFRIRHINGDWIWFTNSGVAIKDDQGVVQHFMGIGMDITERKRVEETLAQREKRLRAIIDNAEEIIYTLNWEGRFEFLSPAWTHITGRSLSEAIGENFIPFVHPEDRDSCLNFLKRVYETGQPHRGLEFRTQNTSGEWLWFSVSGAAIKDEQGKPLYYVGVGMNITERKHAEEERLALERSMQQVQKLESLGVLAGGIAHDFNNLLMAILGHAELAKLSLEKENIVQTNLSRIEKAAGRAAELCQQMLAYAGKGNFIIEQIRLDGLIHEMLSFLEATISKKIKLSLHLGEQDSPILGDATQIRQVILNLITNAAEAIGVNEGTIAIRTDIAPKVPKHRCLMENRYEGPWVVLEIKDTGCGMDQQTLERMYDPFFTTKFTGRGLGMAAVQGIMRSHRGHIDVKTTPHRGTRFRLYFPIIAEEALEKNIPLPAPSPGHAHHGRVLLVDDEEELRIVGANMLKVLGYEVVTAANGKKAMHILSTQKKTFDLILLDLTMPSMDGKETLQELRRIDEQIPVIIASGYAEPDIAERFAGMEMNGFIQKPYTFDKLGAVLSKTLAREKF